MWFKPLLFILFCLAGAAAIMRGWFTHPSPPAPIVRQLPDDFQATVEEVDAAMEAAWARAGVQPAPKAPDLLIARRLSLALTGTLPSLEEIRAFEQWPESAVPQAWLSHLFADRRHADYLAERFARVTVGVENGPFLIYRRRRLIQWLSDAFLKNKPYDQLVRELITAQGVWTSRPEVNFLTVTVDPNNDGQGPDEAKLAARVTRAFLGVRLDCVQCHDDKLGDRWQQEDFHQLAAFFAGAEMSLTGVRDTETPYHFRYHRQPEAEEVVPQVPFAPDLLPPAGTARERLAQWVTAPDNQAFARSTVNRIWALLFNQPLVEPVDQIPLEGPVPAALDLLARDLAAHQFDLQRLIRVIAATQAFQRHSRAAPGQPPLTQAHFQSFAAFPLTRLRPEQAAGSLIQSASLKTVDAESHILFRLARHTQLRQFVRRFGDLGEDEFAARGGTIPQRLLLMNGELVQERTKDDLVMNAAPRIALLAPDDATAVRTAYLTLLTRAPTQPELDHFTAHLEGTDGKERTRRIQDLCWTLINATEFSWNH